MADRAKAINKFADKVSDIKSDRKIYKIIFKKKQTFRRI